MSTITPDMMESREDQLPHHPMALDDISVGPWAKIDQWSEKLSLLINPILIKEARQALKSKQFTITYFLLLFAALCWTVAGVVLMSPDIYYVPTGAQMMIGYYLVLAIPMIAIVPLAAHRSLAAEIDDGTFEMLAITRLKSMGIVLGKLSSATLQMLMYLATLVPCLAFTYLLRGIDFIAIASILTAIFATTFVLTTLGLLLGALAINRTAQMAALLALLGLIIFAEFTCGAFCIEGMIDGSVSADPEARIALVVCLIVGLSFAVLFIKAAAARIAPVTENRSSGLRRWMFVQQIIWVACLTAFCVLSNDSEPGFFAMVMLGGYWLVMGTLMLAEEPELSPRVLRGLPRTTLSRVFLTWFNPGPGTGFVFAITSGLAGIFAMIATLSLYDLNRFGPTVACGVLMAGYLLCYLSVTRFIVMLFARWIGNSFALSSVTLVVLVMLGMLAPACIDVLFTGSVSNSYHIGHITNWMWTLEEIDRSRLDISLPLLLFFCGFALFLLNMFFLVRELSYRRIAIPTRVQNEEKQIHPADIGKPEVHPLDAE